MMRRYFHSLALASLALIPLGALPRLSSITGDRHEGVAIQQRMHGYLHTRGSQIVDRHGNEVRLTGVSWFGMETENFAPFGLDKRSLDDIMADVSRMGFTVVRLPFSNQFFEPASKPVSIDYSLNPDLQGLQGLALMDKVVESAGAHNLRVVLDRHRPDAKGQSELWYTEMYSETRWISDWQMLAAHYRNNATVVAVDLHNEPHGMASWGTNDLRTDWRLAAERAGNAVLAENPHLLVLVEGVEMVNGDRYWWGGNLSAAGKYPVRLRVPHQLVYSTHDYPSTVTAHPWFQQANYPANLPGLWDSHWGYLMERNIAPVVVGEFGTKNQTASDQEWLASLVHYMGKKRLSAIYWSLNPNSDDTGGIFRDDWQSVEQAKLSAIAPMLDAQRTGAREEEPSQDEGPPEPTHTTTAAAVPVERVSAHVSGSATAERDETPVAVRSAMLSAAAEAAARAMAGSSGRETAVAMSSGAEQRVNSGAAHISVQPIVSRQSGPWWGELQLAIKNSAPITAMRAVLRVHRDPGVKPAGQYTNFWGGMVLQDTRDEEGFITYTYELRPGATVGAGGQWLVAAQYGGNGVPRLTSADEWAIEATAGGNTQSFSGHF
jgi:aryl-phospho-beta-D-glucosidase BglC (GH1 family)